MPVQLNDPELEGFLEDEAERRGRLTKSAALRLILSEARDRRLPTLPAEPSQPVGESAASSNHLVKQPE